MRRVSRRYTKDSQDHLTRGLQYSDTLYNLNQKTFSSWSLTNKNKLSK